MPSEDVAPETQDIEQETVDESGGDETTAPNDSPVVPVGTIMRAERLGVSQAEIDAFDTPEQISVYLDGIERRAARSGDAAGLGEGQTRDVPDDGEDTEFSFSEDADPEIVAAFKKLRQQTESERRKFRDEISSLKQAYGQTEQEQFESDVDQFIRSVGDHSLYADTKTGRQNLRNLATFAQTYRDGVRAGNRNPRPNAQILEWAHRALFGDKIAAQARKQVESEVEEHRSKFTQRPTRTEPSKVDGKTKSMGTISKFLRDNR